MSGGAIVHTWVASAGGVFHRSAVCRGTDMVLNWSYGWWLDYTRVVVHVSVQYREPSAEVEVVCAGAARA